MMRSIVITAPLLAAALSLSAASVRAEAPQIIELTQTGCQFVEPENGVNHGFSPQTAKDCESINSNSAQDRLTTAQPMTLKAGTYIFRVTNENVPYELGFWLRDQDYDWRNPLHKLTKTNVSGGGLTTGVSRDYEVELKAGQYHFSCPLNPTPNYALIVE